MHRVDAPFLPRFCVTAFVVLAMLSGSIVAAAQVTGTSYSSQAYGFTVEWSDDWEFDADYEGEGRIFLTRGNEFALAIFAFDGSDMNPQEAARPFPGEIVIEDHSGDPVPWAIVEEEGSYLVVEAHAINGGDTTIMVMLITPPELVDNAIAFVQQEVTINGSPVLAAQAIADSISSGEGRGTSGTSRTGRGTDTSAQPTEEATSEVARTSRTGSETQETPEPTEAATEILSDQGLATFTGPVYGYTVTYDAAVWSVDAEINEGNVDGVRLHGEFSTYTIWAWDAYSSNPLACLEGEIAYYSTQIDAISEWETVIGSGGEPLRYESDDLAWGIFSLIYTDEQGNSYELVDYISCEPIPGQDAVLIVLLSANIDSFDTEFDQALDVLDTLDFGDAPQLDGTDTGQSTGGEISISLDSTTYTSPTYGFTAMIPLEWQIIEESMDGAEERLVLSNGTSEVTLWATAGYTGDLAGCVDFAANRSGLELALDSDAGGGEFRGVYRNEAFGNFVYEEDGVRMMYFINCQAIPGTNAHLILIHDVEYSEFTAERRFRSEIENSITMP